MSALTGEPALAAAAVAKHPFLDVVAALAASPVALAADQIPAKLEGMSFGDVSWPGQA